MNPKAYKIILTVAMLLVGMSCSIRQNWDDCEPLPQPPPPAIDPQGKLVLDFECINRNYFFPDVVQDLELLFYAEDGKLISELEFTAAELNDTDWTVPLSEEWGPPEGRYTIVALVNYAAEDHISITGKEQKAQFLATLDHDPDQWVHYTLKDTYHGTTELQIVYEPGEEKHHTVYLSKNTNTIKLTVQFDNELETALLDSYRSYLAGQNARLLWNYSIPPHPRVYYGAYQTSFGDGRPIIEDYHKTMRLQTDTDLKLKLEFVEGANSFAETIDVPNVLSRVEKNGERIYDTDEKLEQHDFFEITVIIGSQFTVVALVIEGWYLVVSGEDI